MSLRKHAWWACAACWNVASPPARFLVSATANSAESSALLALHDFCGWSLGWSRSIDACEGGALGFGWDGIECDASDQHIEKVELQDRPELACDLTGLDDVADFNPAVLTRLISFTALGTMLRGQLPQSLGDLPSLTVLNLDDNLLEGDVTNYTFASPTLATLRLNRNLLSGEIPGDLAGKQQLVELDLSHNQLHGDIVSKLSAAAALVFVDLSNNSFTGALPVFGTESHLATLKVSHNRFSGRIPNTIGSFGSDGNGLVVLHAAGNQLTGTLPSAIGLLSSLEELDVSDNLLTGRLPALHTLPAISAANAVMLGGNVFACPVPTTAEVYDSAVCECSAGAAGAKGAYDGELWDASACRDSVGTLETACAGLSRFTCAVCAAGYFSAAVWASACDECDTGCVRA